MMELKPCPFCGGSSLRMWERGPVGAGEIRMMCMKCKACGPMIPTMNPKHMTEAKAAWNRRVGEHK